MQFKKTTSLTLAFALAIGSGAAFAQTMSKTGKPLTAQQSRMVDCNKEATGKIGAARKTFMSACLKGHPAAVAPMAVAPVAGAKMTQQEKMKTCNADAKVKALKGADRKTYMKSCLKSDTATADAPAAVAPMAANAKTMQQEKMKTCSADAKTKALKGAARKSYMSTCLKGDAAAAH